MVLSPAAKSFPKKCIAEAIITDYLPLPSSWLYCDRLVTHPLYNHRALVHCKRGVVLNVNFLKTVLTQRSTAVRFCVVSVAILGVAVGQNHQLLGVLFLQAGCLRGQTDLIVMLPSLVAF